MVNPKLKRLYHTIFPNEWTKILRNELLDCKKVLDIGCGPNSPIQYSNISFSVGVEIFEPYIKESKKNGIHNKYIKGDIKEIDFKEESFDAVICLDFIEHLSKEEGYELIMKMEKWARKKIILYTPNGYIWQGDYDANSFQKHKSGWKIEELTELNYKVYGSGGWRLLKGYKSNIRYKPYIFWKIFSDITQKVTYGHPRFASSLWAIKIIN